MSWLGVWGHREPVLPGEGGGLRDSSGRQEMWVRNTIERPFAGERARGSRGRDQVDGMKVDCGGLTVLRTASLSASRRLPVASVDRNNTASASTLCLGGEIRGGADCGSEQTIRPQHGPAHPEGRVAGEAGERRRVFFSRTGAARRPQGGPAWFAAGQSGGHLEVIWRSSGGRLGEHRPTVLPVLRLAPLILRNILRHRRRSLLTLASTAVSLAVLGLVVALYQGFFFAPPSSPSEARQLITRHKVSLTNLLPAAHQARIAAIDGVDSVSANTWFGGVYIDNTPQNFFGRFAVDPETMRKVYPDNSAPKEQWQAFERNRTGAAVARKIANDQKLKIGDRLNISGDIYPVDLELTVEAIFDHPPNTESVWFHREYLSELLKASGATRPDTVGTYAILAETADDVPRIARAVDAVFENSPFPTKTESEKDFALSFLAFLGNVKLYLAVICAAVAFTILLVSANTVAMSVRERTREIAILRTLGYAPSEVLQTVIGESVLIALLGGCIGILITFVLTIAASAGLGSFGAKMQLTPEVALVVMVTALLIGVAAACVPALLASRRNIVESLRYTG